MKRVRPTMIQRTVNALGAIASTAGGWARLYEHGFTIRQVYAAVDRGELTSTREGGVRSTHGDHAATGAS